MESYKGAFGLLKWSLQPKKMRIVSVCLALLSLLFIQQQAALSLNVDQAREALNSSDNGSYSVMHAPSNERNRELAEEVNEEEDEEDTVASFLDHADEAGDPEDSDVGDKDEKFSFLEDMENSDFDEEDYDLDAMDDEDAKVIADSMQGEEQTAFLQRWEAHKANRQANGNPDKRGSFAEF